MLNPSRYRGPVEPGKTFRPRGGRAALCAMAFVTLALAGCVTSPAPVLTGAKQELGASGQIHAFFLRGNEGNEDLGTFTFKWTDNRYLLSSRGKLPFSEFTMHPLDGEDRLLQIFATEPREYQYYVMHPIAQGAYSLIPLMVEMFDEATRQKLCKPNNPSPCEVTTSEQLYAAARAAARDLSAKPVGVVVMVKTA
jgi:hypothetical protein